jgi:hypothetical protein
MAYGSHLGWVSTTTAADFASEQFILWWDGDSSASGA